MSLNLEKKKKQVQDLAETFDQSNTFYLLDYVNISVNKSRELRKNLRENDSLLKVIKNRLALRALKEAYPDDLKQYFRGPTAVAFTHENPIALARLLRDFSGQNKILKVKAGVIDGEFVDEEKFGQIANLTSRDDLIARLGYFMTYPLTRLLRAWQAPFSSLGSMLSQLKSKK